MVKICLDAGHIGKYNRSPVVPAYYESDMNWKLHVLLKKYLEEYGFEVVLTRKTQDEPMNVIPRGEKAKGCDLFLSIHSNACDTENVDYPVVIVPINGTGDAIGKKLAECIGKVMGTRQEGKIWERRSGSQDWYGVIRGAVSVGVPGLILEHSFHTNTRAAKWLLDNGNLDKLAKAEAEVIAKHYGLEKPVEQSVIYRVQVGAYKQKKYAENTLNKLEAAGYDGFLVQIDGLYKVQVGAFREKDYAKNMLAAVKKAGFDAFITEVVPEAKVNIADIVKEVLSGKYGNGAERKQKLTAEYGADIAQAVQDEINRMYK